VVAVANDVAVADPVDLDRRQRLTVELREPEPPPVRVRGGVRPERAVEGPRLQRLDGAVDRRDGDRLDAALPVHGGRRPPLPVVEQLEPLRRQAAHAPHHRRAAALGDEPVEAVVGRRGGRGDPRDGQDRVEAEQRREERDEDTAQPAEQERDADERRGRAEPAPPARREAAEMAEVAGGRRCEASGHSRHCPTPAAGRGAASARPPSPGA
jgi:hypothetical protein